MSLFEIAFYLKIPVYRLREEMPYQEFLGWIDYFARRPYGWREDDRTYKLMRVQGTEQRATDLFPALSAIYNQPVEHKDGMLQSNFKGTSIFMKMLEARGGDKVSL